MASLPKNLGVLQIEPTDLCNLACRMCAPHADAWSTVHGVPKGRMTREVHARVLDAIVREDCRFDHVIYQWLGDPSVHPELEELLVEASVALEGRADYLRVDTNGVLLGPARIERLLAARNPAMPLLVVLTVDAATRATYARVKGRDHFGLATRHARHLLSARRRHPPGVHLQLQFVVQPGNAHEAGDFLRTWEAAARCRAHEGSHVEVLFKPLSVGGGARGQAAADALYVDTLARADIVAREEPGFAVRAWSDKPWQRDDAPVAAKSTSPCPGPWLTPVLRHDGALQACCSDLGGTHVLGNVATEGFLPLWNGPRARALRAELLAGGRPGACAGCGGINWYAMPPDATVTVEG